MELRDYQKEAREAIQGEWKMGRKRTLLVLPTGCHMPDQGILMANGEIKKAKEIKIGDLLMGDDGTPRTVLRLHHGEDTMYRVIPIKGTPFVVNGDHILPLIRTNEKQKPKYPSQMLGGTIDTIKVKDWRNQSKWYRHIHKLFRSERITAFKNDSYSKITVDPYFLGVLLGDGGIKTSINITTPEPEIVEVIKEQAKLYGMTIREMPAGKATTYFMRADVMGRKGGKLHNELLELGIYGKGAKEKSIPLCYKTAPINERLAVLAGLIDTDGSLTINGYDFISASKQLSEDVAYIARSAGLAAYVSKSIKSSQTGYTDVYWRVSISGNCDCVPLRVIRKRAEKRNQKKDVLRTGIKDIEVAGKGEYFGFTVDGNNLYLLDDFTVTHNCGKTIVFSKVIEDRVKLGERVLVLAHRSELLEQASDKLAKATGIGTATEKAEESCLGSFFRVVVGSVQTLQRPKRLAGFSKDYFDTIVVDEAHHCISDGYQRVLQHFDGANVLGVTATPDRGDMRSLGSYFESIAYEYTLPKAIKSGYLSPIKALTLPLELDLSSVSIQAGDFKASEIGTALDPYLEQIAAQMKDYCKDRKTVVFLPLVKTSQKFKDILNSHGFRAAEVNGESKDRAEVLDAFDKGDYNVLCNSMLLTEGWDCPSVDCVIVLRPTKIRSLYSQMVGRGTRLYPGKTELLLLDFLWHTERHELCHPASLICEREEVAKKMTENAEPGVAYDLEEAEKQAAEDVVAQREEALAKQLETMRNRKKKLVDPLQFEMSIQAEDLSNYTPAFGWEMAPPSDKQIKALEKYGILPDEIGNAGKANLILDRLSKRRQEGLTTPKQIRCLEGKGFQHVGTWSFESAKKLIDRIAGNNWRVPQGINPAEYKGS